MNTSEINGDQPPVQVLIVGAGPVGMALAVLLNRFGVSFAVLERAAGIGDHPKARGADVRTMELFRQWGIDEKVKARGLPAWADVFAFVDTIAGHEYGRTVPEPNLGHSPAWRCIVSQDVVEDELLSAASQATHGHIYHETEFLRYETTDTGVIVHSRGVKTGREQRWKATYIVGADGASSAVRRQAGIEMRGPMTLAVMANDYWTADLTGVPRIDCTAVYRIRPKRPGEAVWTVLNTNGRDRWLSTGQVGTEDDERPGPRTDEEVVAMARSQTGMPNLDVKVINRSIWRLSRQVADRYAAGRVFLVGDSAHRFPPTGGLGMNSGIQDAHNLAWKLSAVLTGRAGPGLLASYDLERRPIAESNANFSLGNHGRFLQTDKAFNSGNRDQMEFWIRDSNGHVHSSGQSLGFSYEEGAVILDGTVKAPLHPRRYEPSDRPGGRFPHWWTNLARTESTLDWFDTRFVLVVGPQSTEWMEAARTVAGQTGVPIDIRQIDAAPDAAGLQMGLRGAVLVRPDGHVAWRMGWTPSDPVRELGESIDTLLDRQHIIR